jgi:hypothetical protein
MFNIESKLENIDSYDNNNTSLRSPGPSNVYLSK